MFSRMKIALVPLLLAIPMVPAQSEQTDPAAQYTALLNLTTMTQEGKSPFHLKLDVQLADLKGKPSMAGTAEEWWVNPRQYRIEYIAGDLHRTVESGVEDTKPTELHRELYLLSKALSLWTSPLPAPRENEVVSRGTGRFGAYSFSCFDVAMQPRSEGSPFACSDTNALDVRVTGNDPEFAIREKVGMFQGTQVPLSATVRYNSLLAFTAKPTTLQPLASGAGEALKLVSGDALLRGNSRVAAGSLLTKVQPEYPALARQEHIFGTVVLEALISKEGTIAQLIPIATPDVLLTEAAVKAVRKWTYLPYVLDGQPTEVDTTIRINFNMTVSR